MIYAFYRNLADKPTFKLLSLCAFCVFLLFQAPQESHSRSAYSPRHSGMEPPGGPRPFEGMPSRSMGQNMDGSKGYTDAYGNTLEDRPPEEKKAKRRLRPGAYSSGAESANSRPLPDPAAENSSPLWKF